MTVGTFQTKDVVSLGVSGNIPQRNVTHDVSSILSTEPQPSASWQCSETLVERECGRYCFLDG